MICTADNSVSMLAKAALLDTNLGQFIDGLEASSKRWQARDLVPYYYYSYARTVTVTVTSQA